MTPAAVLDLFATIPAPLAGIITGLATVAVSIYVARLTARKTRIDIWQASFDTLAKANAELRAEIDDARAQVKELKDQLTRVRAELAAVRRGRAADTAQLASLTETVNGGRSATDDNFQDEKGNPLSAVVSGAGITPLETKAAAKKAAKAAG